MPPTARPQPRDAARQLRVLRDVAAIAAAEGELRPMLQRVSRRVRRLCRLDVVAVATVDSRRQTLVCEAFAAGRAVPETVGRELPLVGLPAEAVASGGVVAWSAGDPGAGCVPLPGMRSELLLPIHRDGEVAAVLMAASSHRSSLETHRDLLRAVADQVTGAMTAAQRFEDLRQHAAFLEALARVSHVALGGEGLGDTLHRIVDSVGELLPSGATSILLLDESGTRFQFEVYAGDIELSMPSDWTIDIGVCGRCVRTGEPQLVLDPAADPDYYTGNPEVASELIVPIRFRDRTLGVLNLESTRRGVFTPHFQKVIVHLADQVAGAIHLAQLHAQLERANAELERLTQIDPLTGLANRRGFDTVLATEWRRAQRLRRPFTIMLADLDCFKTLNDTHGHPYGDECLRRVGESLALSLRRPGDVVARYGGEEFAVVLPGVDGDEARTFGERLRRRVTSLDLEHRASTVASRVTVSVGVASVVAHPGIAAEELVQAADAALYEAKQAGRDRVVVRRLESPELPAS